MSSSPYYSAIADEMNAPSISPRSSIPDWTMAETFMDNFAYVDTVVQFPEFKMAPLGYGPVEYNDGYYTLQVPQSQADYAELGFGHAATALTSSMSSAPCMVASPGPRPSSSTAPRGMSLIPTPPPPQPSAATPVVNHVHAPTVHAPTRPQAGNEPEPSKPDGKPKNRGTKRKQPSPTPPPPMPSINLSRPKPQSHLRTAKRVDRGNNNNKPSWRSSDRQQVVSPLSAAEGATGTPAVKTEEQQDSETKARAAHNQVEQQYRQRLNAHFERLLAVLPVPDDNAEDEEAPGSGNGVGGGTIMEPERRKVSKAEVLEMARRHIEVLESEVRRLEKEKQEMLLG